MITLRVREILDEQHKTPYWLAKQTGMSQNNIGKICNNETNNMRFETLEKLCAALECTPNDLFVSNDPHVSRMLKYNDRAINYESKDDTM